VVATAIAYLRRLIAVAVIHSPPVPTNKANELASCVRVRAALDLDLDDRGRGRLCLITACLP
jgi:hypothetical protein